VALIRQRARGFKETFEKHGVKAQVAYASKAFSTIAMVQVVHEEGLSLDVVSGGELYTALAADFPKERIHFHGNNKSRAELEMAIKEDVGCIVVDNFYEIALLQEITEQYQKKMPVLLRLTPGIEAHTHDYILTGQEDSKFGFDLQNGQADEAVRLVQNSKGLELLGIHCHIGSQIFETTGFIMERVETTYRICSASIKFRRRLWHSLYGRRSAYSCFAVCGSYYRRGQKAV
jgi:diaminopimelate decarboxylase